MKSIIPLAARIRPLNLSEYVGQQHILGENSALSKSIEHGNLHSMVLWGPPGTGKTTLAKILAAHCNAEIETISAVSAGIKDIRAIVQASEQRQKLQQRTVVFIDEVHRFNKTQQDALLPHIENGLFTLIGATTENPSFELNNALLSRVQVYTLNALANEDLVKLLRRALSNRADGLGDLELEIDDPTLTKLASSAQGDARAALGVLEIAANFATASDSNTIHEDFLNKALRERASQFDKKGDHFYNQISALHKAVRGSSPDAALYWLARMLRGGCDPLYVARRVVRMASEDIGNADPRGLRVALDAWDVQARLGSPEGELSLAQAVVYLAVAPKSNAVYNGFKAALDAVSAYPSEEVPMHIRNAPTALMKDLDYGKDYQYAHNYDDAYVAGESYFPEALKDSVFYKPVQQGLERKIADKLSNLKELDNNSAFSRYPKGSGLIK